MDREKADRIAKESPLVEHGPYEIVGGWLLDANQMALAQLYDPDHQEECGWDRALVNLLNVVAKRGRVLP
jgi:hypothetical protein